MRSTLRTAALLGSLGLVGCTDSPTSHDAQIAARDEVILAANGSIRKLLGQESFIGIGIAITRGANDSTVIEYVLPGSPAEQAGLYSGDLILAIDGTSVAEADYLQVGKDLTDPKRLGTTMTITILRDRQTLDVAVSVKTLQHIPSVKIIEPQE